VSLVAQWHRIESELPEDWADAQLALEVPNSIQRARAAALLGPANPGRAGSDLRFAAHKRGAGAGAEAIRRLLQRLDSNRIRGNLRLVETSETPQAAAVDRAGLAPAWDAALATLPPDWSDLYCEVDFTSSDYLQRAALLLAPVNPTKIPGRSGFRFRVARRFGYGASPQMTRRCLERIDAEGIVGHVSILRALSDTHNVATLGPVWYLEGKPV
jgi:hypothetical protein